MTVPNWLGYTFVALFLWAECLDFVGLRTLVRWVRR